MFEVETVTCKSLTSLSLSLSPPLSSLPLECMIKHLFMILATHSVTGNNLVASFGITWGLRRSNVPRLHMQIWLNSWVSLYAHTPVLGGYHLFAISIRQGYPPFFCLPDIYIYIFIYLFILYIILYIFLIIF